MSNVHTQRLAALDFIARVNRERSNDPDEMRERNERELAAAAETERDLEYAADGRRPPTFFHRPEGEPVPWRHRGPVSDRTTHQAKEAA